MKDWSINCLGLSKPKVFLDTNILSYLIDGTFPSLNKLLQSLRGTCLFDLISSDYCKSEFVGIRKREHYLRLSVQQAMKGNNSLNFSSLLKYHNQFGSVEVPFESIIDQIRDNVKAELQKITTDFGIDFSCTLHAGLTNLANEVCLNSKISKEDSLVMVSSIIPSSGIKYDNVILVTHDNDFVKWYNEEPAKSKINSCFTGNSLSEPYFIDSKNVFGHNLDKEVNPENVIPDFLNWFIDRFKDFYIGKTIVPIPECPQDSFAIKAEINKSIHQGSYVFVVGRELDYMYAIPNVLDFYHKGASIEDGYCFTSKADNILSARISYNDIDFESTEIYNEILQSLREEGNWLFYLPSTMM